MARQSSAYGHEIHRFRSEPCCEGWGSSGREVRCDMGIRCPGAHEVTEQLPWGDKTYTFRAGGTPVVFHASYGYVTGRAGRVTHRNLFLCEACGEKWCARQGVAVPAEAR